MDKEEQVAELLSNLSEQDLENLTNLLQNKTTKKTTKKKQAKKRTPRKKTTKKKDTPNFMHGIRLNQQEQEELNTFINYYKTYSVKSMSDTKVPLIKVLKEIEITSLVCFSFGSTP